MWSEIVFPWFKLCLFRPNCFLYKLKQPKKLKHAIIFCWFTFVSRLYKFKNFEIKKEHQNLYFVNKFCQLWQHHFLLLWCILLYGYNQRNKRRNKHQPVQKDVRVGRLSRVWYVHRSLKQRSPSQSVMV